MKAFSRLASIKPGEESLSLLLFSYFFLITAAYSIIKSLRVAYYLEKEGAKKLPLAYFLAAVLSGLVVSLHSQLQVRVRHNSLVMFSLLFFTSTAVVFTFLFRSSLKWVPLAYWIWANILVVVLVTQFWVQVNQTFNPREAKRLIGFLGSGGILGGIAGGEMTGWLAEAETSHNLLLCAAGMLIVCAGVVYALSKRERSLALGSIQKTSNSGIEKNESRDSGFKSCFDAVRQSPYLTLIASSVSVALIVSTLIDWQFSHMIEQSAALRRNLTSFLGHFNAGLLVFALLFQLFLTGRIIKNFGMRISLLVSPLFLLACSAGIGVAPGLIFALLIMGGDKSLHYSIDQSVHKLLYIPVPPHMKHRAEVFIDMFLDRFAKCFGAVILFVFLSLGFGVRLVSLVSVLLISVWAFLNFRISREYARTVQRKLKLKWSRADKAVAEKVDMDSVKLVFDALESKNRSSVLYAMHLFDMVKQDKLTPDIKRLMAEQAGELSVNPLGSLLEAGKSVALPVADEIFDEEVLQKEIPEILSLDVYQEVMKQHIEQVLAGKGRTDIDSRMEVAKAMGFMDPRSPLVQQLVRLLRDESMDVRRYAVESAGRLMKREYVSELIFNLKDPATQTEAADALAKYGVRILGTLGDYLKDPNERPDVRMAIPPIMARISSQDSVDILLRALGEAEVGAEVVKALDRIRAENKEVDFSEVEVKKRIDSDIRACCRILIEPEGQATYSRKLEPSPEQQKATDDLLAEIFKLLGLIFPHEDITKAYQNWRTGDRNSVAYAIELLDNALDRPAKEKLFPLIEDMSCEERARKCRSLLKNLS